MYIGCISRRTIGNGVAEVHWAMVVRVWGEGDGAVVVQRRGTVWYSNCVSGFNRLTCDFSDGQYFAVVVFVVGQNWDGDRFVFWCAR